MSQHFRSSSWLSNKHSSNVRPSILLTPGPTEADPKVMAEMSHAPESHFTQEFCETFGETLKLVRRVFQSEDPRTQPFVIGGSGSLGWDFVATNFIEPGESVLCLTTGFFSNAFEMCLSTYGCNTKKIAPPYGAAPDLAEVEQELRRHKYKALVATHVETATAVLTHLKPLADLIQRVSPGTLFIVDGVASIGCEEFHFDDWAVDVAVTGSQKALSCPPGLSIIMTSHKALTVAAKRTAAPTSWYASLSRWLPIMQSYERGEPCYFATPPTQIVRALRASLLSALSQPLAWRFEQHKLKSQQVKHTIKSLGLVQVSIDPNSRANGLTAFWCPPGMTSKMFLSEMSARGFVLAGGMHPEFGTRIARFGHMGFAAVDGDGWRIDAGLEAFKDIMKKHYAKEVSASMVEPENTIIAQPEAIAV